MTAIAPMTELGVASEVGTLLAVAELGKLLDRRGGEPRPVLATAET